VSACCVGQQQHVGYLLPTALAALQQWQFGAVFPNPQIVI